jgi:hypothetical protein
MVKPQRRQSVASFSLQKPGFNPKIAHVEFVVDTGKGFTLHTSEFLHTNYLSSSAQYSFIYNTG